MKSLRICCCLLLCVAYVTVVGCKDEKDEKTVALLHRITITNCIPDHDTVGVHDSEQVAWVPDVDYQVMFLPTATPNGPKVPTSNNPFKITAGTSVPRIMQGPSNCSAVGCNYKYSLTRYQNGLPEPLPCIDPSIRIVPVNVSWQN